MLFQAAEALKIDFAKSFMIGDRWRDVDHGDTVKMFAQDAGQAGFE